MLLYWIWYAQLTGISQRAKAELLMHFSDPEDLFFAEAETLQPLVSADQLQYLLERDLKEAEKILAQCRRKEIGILPFSDRAYPEKLRNIADPPMVLYYKGQLPDWDVQPVIGLVGTRKASAYGLQVANQLGGELARCGAAVISGGADGADAQGMWGALQQEGTVICVLGGGVDVIYPRCNRRLFAQTEENGCLLSEYPPETAAIGWHFPQRNRIISGISDGVIVVEAPEKSGALNTAHHALEQERDLYAVPANIGVSSGAGSNQLLLEKAQAVLSGWDVVKRYAHLYPRAVREQGSFKSRRPEDIQAKVAQKPVIPEKLPEKVIDNSENSTYSELENTKPAFDQEEQEIFALLDHRPQHPDAIAARSVLPSARVQAILTKLTVKGVVKFHPGGRVSLK